MTDIYRVFLSSTGRDLNDYRTKVFEALQRKPDVKVVRMEDFVAEDGAPKDICAREVKSCDIVVGLVGFCYGASPPRFKRSFTHLEYDEAVAAGIPLLMHIAPDGVAFPAHTRETDELHRRVMDFRTKLFKSHTVGQKTAWENEDSLASHVAEAVERKLDELRVASMPGFTKCKHELGLKGRRADIVALLAEEGAEHDLLLAEKAEVEKKLGDLEQSFSQAKTKILELEALLDRESNEIGGERLAEARAALEQGDFSKADDLFAEIEARAQMAVQSAARAAYGRGEIAEEQVRWADAAEHYARAARLDSGFRHLRKAWEFTHRAGDYMTTAHLAEELVKAAGSEFGDATTETADALNCRASTLNSMGRLDEAEPLFRQALEIDANTIRTAHPDYAAGLNNLAVLLKAMGRFDEAEPLYRQAMEITEKALGTAHPDYANRLNNLASLLRAMGRFDAAEPLYRQALEIGEKTIGTAHPEYAKHLNNLAGLLQDMGGFDEAEPLYRQALEIGGKTIGTAHPDYATRLNNLAVLLKAMGRFDEAEPLYRQAMEVLHAKLGPDHPKTKTVEANYADFLKERDGGG